MGHADRLAWADSLLPHGLAYNVRLSIYNWFNRWLKNASPVQEEPGVSPEPEELLFAAEGGSTVRAFHGETPVSMVRRKKIVRQPRRSRNSARSGSCEERGRQPSAKQDSGGPWIEAVEIQSAPKVWIPGYLFQPRVDHGKRPLIVLLDPAG